MRSLAAVVVVAAVVPLLLAGGAMPRALGTSTDAASTPVAISAGNERACALLSGGTIKCWGNQASGTASYSSTPVSVKGISAARAVSAGDDLACALLSGDAVTCWGGRAASGQSSSTPVSVTAISGAVAIGTGGWSVTGDTQACALLSGGTIKCWGGNSVGELGNGTTTACSSGSTCFSSTPVSVTGISNATAISAGGDGGPFSVGAGGACALLSGGTIKCWGSNGGGALGNGTRRLYSSTPVSVKGISTAKAVSTGGAGGCALLSGGTIKCWGLNQYGQLGNGSKPYIQASSTPVSVKGISAAKALSTGSRGSCALLSVGTVNCWGDNRYGELGTGKAGSYLYPYSFTPVAVKGL